MKLLLKRANDSLVLSIEIFNRPWDRGRLEAFLILFDHSFELLLKSAILHRGGKINKKGKNETIGFDQCVRSAIGYKVITEEQALTLQTINGLRDAAQHYVLELSEQHLYLHAQSGFTLYSDILKNVFQKEITKELPKRVLPLSTMPPLDIETLFTNEVEEIRKLLIPKTRHRTEAIIRLRALAIFDGAIRGEVLQPSQEYLRNLADQIKENKSWEEIFQGVASVNLTPEESNHEISLRIAKKEGIPVYLVPEGTPGASRIAVRRVNELDYYNLSHTELAKKVDLSSPKLTALAWFLKLKEDEKYCKEIKIGGSKFCRYSQNAIHKIREEFPKTNINEVWEEFKSRNLK